MYKQKIPAQNIPCPAARMTARWQTPGNSPDLELAHLAIKPGPSSHLEPVLRKAMDFANLVLPMFAFHLLPKQLKTCRPNTFSISGKWNDPSIGRSEAKMVRKFKRTLDKSIGD